MIVHIVEMDTRRVIVMVDMRGRQREKMRVNFGTMPVMSVNVLKWR